VDNLRTCVCGASKQISREKTNLKRILAEIQARKDNLLAREQALAQQETKLREASKTYNLCEVELKSKEDELNYKIEKLNENYRT